MLRAGRGKAPAAVVAPVVADALDLPLPDGSASGAIVAFGIRNVVDLDRALREMHRVLEPGARFVILEFPDTERAKAWWSSPEYAEAKKLRHATAKSRMLLVDGLPPDWKP